MACQIEFQPLAYAETSIFTKIPHGFYYYDYLAVLMSSIYNEIFIYYRTVIVHHRF